MFFQNVVLIVGGILCVSQAFGEGQRFELVDVLRRAGSYVEEFQRQLSGIVTEEAYLQELCPRSE